MRCQPCRWVSRSDPVRHERTDSETVEEFFLEGFKTEMAWIRTKYECDEEDMVW
jgi:hypothetical protein